MPENRNDQSRTMERSFNKRGRQGVSFSAMLAVFLLLFCASVLGNPPSSTNEPQPDCYHNSAGTGFMCTSPSGRFSLNNAVNSITLSPTAYYFPPLAGRLSTTSDNPYILKVETFPGLTTNNLVVYEWNVTLNGLVSKATYPLVRNDTSTHPAVYRFASRNNYGTIVIANQAGNNIHNITMLEFNGTSFNKVCESANFSAFDSPYIMGFDDEYELVAYISGRYGTETTSAVLMNNTCGIISTFSQNIGAPRLGSEDGQRFTPYMGITIANLFNDNHHQLIYPVANSQVAGFKVLTYNRTGSLNNEEQVNGQDSYFGKYTCSNGKCNISDTLQISQPLWDYDHNYIISAVEKTSSNSDDCGAYCLLATDAYGNFLWQTSGSYFRNSCGKSGSAQNVTFFQPVLIDSPAEDAPLVPKRVCGACQAVNDNVVYMACFKTLDGTQTATGSFTAPGNLFQNMTPSSNSIPTYNPIIAAQFNGDADLYSRLLIRDKIYDTNLNIEYNFGANQNVKVLYPSYGDMRPHDPTEARNPSLALTSNQSNSFYYTTTQNTLPYYTEGSYSWSPPPNLNACGTQLPVCLNFSKQNGINVQYMAQDADLQDTLYGRHFCDINTQGDQNFYNYTNWSTNEGVTGNLFCRYNRTGTITLVTQLTDDKHINTSGITQVSQIYSIIDSYYPFCYDSYTYQCIQNPNTTRPPSQINARNTSIVPAFDDALNSSGFVGTADRAVLGIIILIVVAITMAILGMVYHAPPQYYTGGIGFVLLGLFFLFLYLRIFQVWILVIILFIAAAMLAIAFTRTISSGGMES